MKTEQDLRCAQERYHEAEDVLFESDGLQGRVAAMMPELLSA